MELNDSVSSKGWYKFLVFVLIIAFFASLSGPKINFGEIFDEIQSEIEAEIENEKEDSSINNIDTDNETKTIGLNDTFTFKGLKIGVGDSYEIREINNAFATDRNEMVIVPLNIQNNNKIVAGVKLADVTLYSANSTEHSSAVFYNSSNDITLMSALLPGETASKEISFYYTGEGIYSAIFTETSGKTYNLEFEVYE